MMPRLRLCPFAALAGLLLATAACNPPQNQKPRSLPPATADEGPAALGKIDPSLREHLEQSGSEELVPVILILERQVTEEEKARLFSQTETQNKLQAKQRERELLIQELKRVAATEQSEILELLDAWEAEGLVRHIRPLWLTNVIGLEARRSAIEKLTALQRIQTILWDPPRQVAGAVEWGVKKIQADQVWTLPPTGYTGTGVTVAILDTGVDYTHPDLENRMWINTAEDKNNDKRFTALDNNDVDDDGNGYIDDVVGWNFSGSGSNDPAPVRNSHGTHVAGIAAGSKTGVAPGARIMALRRSSDVFQFSTQQECWEGMQYALDNHADIVNFSAGWHDDWNPKPDYKRWRDNVKNLMHGGVLFVTVTHNDENTTGAPNNVRTPGRVPVALTVGSTDRTDTISKLSNHGPVTWQTVRPFLDYPWPPGLRKPDVTAPGVDIKSTVLGGGYESMCGTSMAAPHVAGLAALLLEKDPSLSPYELKLIIEETSFDLGPTTPDLRPKPDNVFGWGRIDALEAIKYRISPLPYDLATDRAGLDIWVDNDDDEKPNDPIPGRNHLYARIRNLGGQVVSDVEVRFYSFSASCGSGPRKRIGTYRVPILGPKSSRHETALAVIHWEFQTGDPRCIGVEIAAHPPNRREGNLSNNTGFRKL